MQWQGVLIGACSFLIIGIFHPIVIKTEYYFGKKAWPVFLVVGLAILAAAVLVKHFTLSAILGVFGFSSLWSIKELYEQEERVKRGWFPANPKRTAKK